mmetsp:Transcript_2971/g.5062  ORF Transcript_2971/g.5062 Transcript_2971/m.5062 type:complete len:462 (+) Transcript_2971:74-1459(+)
MSTLSKTKIALLLLFGCILLLWNNEVVVQLQESNSSLQLRGTALNLVTLLRRRLTDDPILDWGSNLVAPGRTVYAGLILSDKKSIMLSPEVHAAKDGENSTRTAELVEQALLQRQKNAQQLVQSFPFKVVKWPSIYSKTCPHFAHNQNQYREWHGNHRSERGIGLSHMQIWLEFLFFDNDVLDARVRPKPEYITSNWYSSISGTFTAVQNGSLYKNGIPYLEEDILLVFDDTVRFISTIEPGPIPSSAVNLSEVLSHELSHMDTDILSFRSAQQILLAEDSGKESRISTNGNGGAEQSIPTASTTTTTSGVNTADNTATAAPVPAVAFNSSISSSDAATAPVPQRMLITDRSIKLPTKLPMTLQVDQASVLLGPQQTQQTRAYRRQLQVQVQQQVKQEPELVTASAVNIAAYAVTRRGLRKLLRYYDHCGKSLAEQFHRVIQKGHLTHRVSDAALLTSAPI